MCNDCNCDPCVCDKRTTRQKILEARKTQMRRSKRQKIPHALRSASRHVDSVPGMQDLSV